MSFYLRLRLAGRFPIQFTPDLHAFLQSLDKVLPVMLLIFAVFGLYNLRSTRKFQTELGKIAAAVSVALMVVVLIFFFNQNIFSSRLIILIAWPMTIVMVVIGRFILKTIQGLFLDRGYGLHNLCIIKSVNPHDAAFLEETIYNKRFGYNIAAEIEDSGDALEQLEKIYEPNKFSEILQANPLATPEQNAALLLFARQHGLVFNYIPNIFDVQRNHVETDTISGVPVISIKNTPLTGWGSVVKRIFDIIVSIFCLVITSPIFLVVAIAIKIDSPGKILYSAPRGGYKKDFTFYKFRTMYNHLSVGAEYGGAEAEKVRHELWKQNARGGETGAFLKIKHDPRVTRVGRILRKTKIDEIPQFLNVLKGDMSMVGPRAHVIDEVERYRDSYRRIFSIKPGIFGLSQIAQISWPDLPFEEEIKLNTFYIENWSLFLDIAILAKSLFYLLFGKKTEEDY